MQSKRNDDQNESFKDRAYRLTESLCGLLREEIAEHGGAEAFVRWVRSDDEDADVYTLPL
jgi:hypothetical protein